MKIECPLCQTEISVLKTKAGKSYTNCHNCHMRLFVNSELGEELLEGMAIDEEASNPETKSDPPQTASARQSSPAEIQNLIAEIKKLKQDVKALKAGATSKSERSQGAMASWMGQKS